MSIFHLFYVAIANSAIFRVDDQYNHVIYLSEESYKDMKPRGNV
jgi:hypothetical protein